MGVSASPSFRDLKKKKEKSENERSQWRCEYGRKAGNVHTHTKLFLSLSLSLSHTHTHTHTYSYSSPQGRPPPLLRAFFSSVLSPFLRQLAPLPRDFEDSVKTVNSHSSLSLSLSLSCQIPHRVLGFYLPKLSYSNDQRE